MTTASAIEELRHQFRRLQGSVNFWNNAARGARQDADRHTGTRQAQDLARLADCEHKAIAAAKQLNHIKDQLTELDPNGARARQNNALRSAIARAKRDVAHFEHLAALPGQNTVTRHHINRRLTNRLAKLAQLNNALAKQKAEAEHLARHKRAQREHLAVIDQLIGYDPMKGTDEDQAQALAEQQRLN